MNKKYLLLLFAILLIGASCQKEEVARTPELSEIIGPGAFIIDQHSLGDGKTLVLYVLDKEAKQEENCEQVPEERLLGRFYLGLIANNVLISKIELLMDSLGDKDNIIKPQDLNGDSRPELVFNSYVSCEANYVEVLGIEEELLRYNFYREEEIVDELLVASPLEYRDGYLIQFDGTSQNYYSFSEEKEGYDFVK